MQTEAPVKIDKGVTGSYMPVLYVQRKVRMHFTSVIAPALRQRCLSRLQYPPQLCDASEAMRCHGASEFECRKERAGPG
jgi:hypothetical protein